MKHYTILLLILAIVTTSCVQEKSSLNIPSTDKTSQTGAYYLLPWKPGDVPDNLPVLQAPGGKTSHTGVELNAIDFKMENNEVRSISHGIVKVICSQDAEGYDTNGIWLGYGDIRYPKCATFSAIDRMNFGYKGHGSVVVVYNIDDSNIISYGHMGGTGEINIHVGDEVSQGTKLGISGNNGWSNPQNLPHLHIDLRINGSTTTGLLPFKEVIDSGKTDGIPEVDKIYKSQNFGLGTCNSWDLNNSSIPFSGNVGGSSISNNIYVTNYENQGTTCSLAFNSNVSWLGSKSVNFNGTTSTSVTLTADACTTAGTESGTISVIGANKTARVNVTRVCGAIVCSQALLTRANLQSCTPTSPAWSASPSGLTFAANVGATPGVQSFTVNNTGGSAGSYSTSSNVGWGRATTNSSGSLNVGQSQNISVSVDSCSSAGSASGAISISGGGASTTVNITRNCSSSSSTGGVVWQFDPREIVFQNATSWVGQGLHVFNRGTQTGQPILFNSASWIQITRGVSSSINAGSDSLAEVDVADCTANDSGEVRGTISVSGNGSSDLMTVIRRCPVGNPSTGSGGEYIQKTQSNLVMDYFSGVRLWTPNNTASQKFKFKLDVATWTNGDGRIVSDRTGECLEFDRTLDRQAFFSGCSDQEKHRWIFDAGSYLGFKDGVESWNIRPRLEPTWCLAAKESSRPATEGDIIVFKQDSCDQPDRRFSVGAFIPPPPERELWVENNGDFGTVQIGQTKSLRMTVRNKGGGRLTGAVTLPNGFRAIGGDLAFDLPGKSVEEWQLEFTPTTVGRYLNSVQASFSGLPSEFVVSGIAPDTTPPSVNIASSLTSTEPNYRLYGTVADNVGVANTAFVLNGSAAQAIGLYGLDFSGNIPLQPGANQITVYAADAAGLQGSQSITVTFTPKPVWSANYSSITMPSQVVDGSSSSAIMVVGNNGTGTATYDITSNNPVFSISPASQSLAVNSTQNVEITAPTCTTVGMQTAALTLSGGNGNTVSISVFRECLSKANPPPVPTGLQVTMSSGGRIFVAWSETSGANHYEFKGTFDGQNVAISGQAPAQSNLTAGAIATFLTAPDAADKQGKQVCLAVRAVNAGGSSAYTNLGCSSYRYYTVATLARSGKDDLPRITINR